MTQGSRYRLTDVLWWTRQGEVFKEIALMMDLVSVDTNTPGWFQHRTRAARNLLDKMTEGERVKLRSEADRMSREGLPEEIQRK
jgi:hypothetical protein